MPGSPGLWLGSWLRFVSRQRMAPYVPTPPEVVERMLTMARLKAGERLVDLGSGDGRLLRAAVQDFGAARADGFELDARLVEIARQETPAEVQERARRTRMHDRMWMYARRRRQCATACAAPTVAAGRPRGDAPARCEERRSGALRCGRRHLVLERQRKCRNASASATVVDAERSHRELCVDDAGRHRAGALVTVAKVHAAGTLVRGAGGTVGRCMTSCAPYTASAAHRRVARTVTMSRTVSSLSGSRLRLVIPSPAHD
eukprot:5716339-Prymnesium_polylepis.1